MKNYTALISLLFLIIFPCISHGQVSVELPVSGNSKLLNEFTEVYPAYNYDWSAQDILDRIESEELKPIEEKVNPSFDNAIHWVQCTIENKKGSPVDIIIEIDKPRTDRSDLYEIKTDTIIHWAVSGDRLGHFDNRSIRNRRVVMNATLEANSTHDFLISVDQVGAPASFPIYLWRQADFAKNDISINVAQGAYFGILLFITLIFLSIGIWIRNKLFIAYALYVAALGMFIFNDLGYAYQYLFPSASVFTNYSRTLIALLFMVATRNFLIHYFDLEKELNIWIKRIFLVSVVVPFIVLILWIVFRSFFNSYTFLILNIVYVCALTFVAIVIGTLILLLKSQRRKALSFLFAYTGLAIGFLFYVGAEYGYLEEQNFIMTPIQLGSLFEVLVLTTLIVLGIKEINDRQSDLMARVAKSQKTLALSIVNTQETERTNIAREIHDAIGGNLAVIKQRAIAAGNDNLELIDNTLSQVRQISHNLYTPVFNSKDLQIRLTALANDYNSDDMEYHVLFHGWPAITNEDVKVHLYRIAQELFQNAKKHSKASQVFMQFLKTDEDSLQVMYEDDGRGFNDEKEDRLGMKNIKYRVETMNGTIDIENNRSGLSINMGFPNSVAMA